jgi:hypothetical protein
MGADAAVSEGAAVAVIAFDPNVIGETSLHNVVVYSRRNTSSGAAAQFLSVLRTITVDVSESQKESFSFAAARAPFSVVIEYLRL